MKLIIFSLFIAFGISQDILDRPTILKHPNDTYTLLGKTVELYCEADGNPYPNIQWYRDKSPVITHKERPVTARITAQNGQLIIHNFEEDLQGSYYCNATNAIGSTASNNAIVKLAYINDEIKSTSEISISIGETISLECISPSGLPIPHVYWQSSEHGVIIPDERIKITPSGNLIIRNAEKSDSGKYYCIAENIAGRKTSPPSSVNVVRKPQFLVTPSDETVSLGGSVTFRCQVEGDPEPTIIWSRKDDHPISSSRSVILADKSLRIDHVQQADMGEYICAANNSALEATARLYVKESPNFIQTPNDTVSKVGEDVIFSCIAKGEPKPIIRWVINNRQYLAPPIGPDEIIGRYTLSHSTLKVSNVDKSDEGSYECRASQEAGIVKSLAKLTIIDPSAKPIPVIEIGPQSMNITADKSIILNCKGRILDTNRINTNAFIAGESKDVMDYRLQTKWYIGGKPFNPTYNTRIVALSSETLQINAIQESDQGTYECRLFIQNDHGEESIQASARANIFVLPNDQISLLGPYIDLNDPRNLPEPPKSIDVDFIGDTWINLSWEDPKQPSEFPILGYRVEYIEYKQSNQWVIAYYNVPHNKNVTIAGLKPKNGYLFSVRSISKIGYGRPVLTSKFVFTSKEITFKDLDPNELNSLASTIQISPIIARPVSKSEVQLSWNVCSTKKMLELISSFEIIYHPRPISECIRYRPFMSGYCSPPLSQDVIFDKKKYCSLSKYYEFDDKFLSDPTFSMSRVKDSNLKIEIKADLNSEEPKVTTIVENLYPFVCYTFEVKAVLNVAMVKSENSLSNPVLTFESMPNQAPDNLRANWKNNGSILQISWDHLNPLHTNGLISQYSLRFIDKKSRNFNKQMINFDQTTYYMDNAQKESNYTVHVAASTCSGEGIRSSPVEVPSWDLVYSENSKKSDLFAFLYDADWPMFLWLLIAGFGIVFFSTFLIFIIFCYRKKTKKDSCFGDGRKIKKSSKFQHLPDNPTGMGEVKNFTNFTQNQEKNLLLMGNGNNYIMYDQSQHNKSLSTQNAFSQNSTSPMALNKFSPTSNGTYFPLGNNNSSSGNTNTNLYTNQMTLDNSYADPSLIGSMQTGNFMGNNQNMMQFGITNSSGNNSNTSRSHGSNQLIVQQQQQQYPQHQYRHDIDDTASPYASTSVVNGPHDGGAGEEEFPGSNSNQLRLTSNMNSNYQGAPQLNIPPPPDSPPPPVPQQFHPVQNSMNVFIVNNSQATVNSSLNSKTITTNTSNSSHASLNNNNNNNDYASRNQQISTTNGSYPAMMTVNHPQQSSFHGSSNITTGTMNLSNPNNPSNQNSYAVYQS